MFQFQNHECSDELPQAYANPVTTTVEGFLERLSTGISRVICNLALAVMKQAVISKVVDYGFKGWRASVERSMAPFREKFVESELVRENARAKLAEFKTANKDEKMLKAVKMIAEITEDSPGDVLQAEYLSEVGDVLI